MNHINLTAALDELNKRLTAMTQQRDVALSDLKFRRDLYTLRIKQLTNTTVQRDEWMEEAMKFKSERDRLAEALRSIKNELGIPQPEYPASVANAVKIADEALQSLTLKP